MRARRLSGFTLIELLVVVAIIALLISILLPSLTAAREQAKAVKCAANMRGCGQAVLGYTTESPGGHYPVSYEYIDEQGRILRQPTAGPGGYLHWSYFLWGKGEVDDQAFQCPSFLNQGAPRTNPGPQGGHWEGDQVDQNSQSAPNALTDKQAPRMAFTANAAIIPRNKFTTQMSGGRRVNRYVRDNEITMTGDTILMAEFNRNWKGEAVNEGGGYLSKSHRPVNPFWHAGGGYNEYATEDAGFRYRPIGSDTYGLASFETIENGVGLIEGSAGSELNAIGRHHPGGTISAARPTSSTATVTSNARPSSRRWRIANGETATTA